MIAIVTLEEARQHLQMDHTIDDTYITGLIYAASQAVVTYLGEDGTVGWLDSSGDLIPDTSDTSDTSNQGLVPEDIRHATLLLIGDFYANREPKASDSVDAQFGYGYLPRAVVALLYPYRTPTIGVPEAEE